MMHAVATLGVCCANAPRGNGNRPGRIQFGIRGRVNTDVDCDEQINPVNSGIVQSLFGTCDPPRDECR